MECPVFLCHRKCVVRGWGDEVGLPILFLSEGGLFRAGWRQCRKTFLNTLSWHGSCFIYK